MKCKKCSGKMFVDRVFSENKNYEVACVLCGARKFVGKSTTFGRWLDKKETAFANAAARTE